MTEARLFSRHSIGTRIAALFMLLILVITAAMTAEPATSANAPILLSTTAQSRPIYVRPTSTG